MHTHGVINLGVSDRRNVDSLFTTLQLGPGQFISVPVSVSQARQNTDLFARSSGFVMDVTEAALLDGMEANGAASFQDLAEVVRS